MASGSGGCGRLDETPHLPPAFPRHLLAANDPPTDVEAAEIRDIVDHLHTRVSDIDVSIKNAEDLLAALRSRRKSAIEDIRRGQGILSIIRHLPADLWGEIFSHTVPDVYRRRAVDTSPWVLGHVCSRWRAISVSLSTLWSHLDCNTPLPMLIEQIKRSKGCSLTAVLFESKTLLTLMNFSSRWETVDIQMGNPRVGDDMLTVLDGSLVHGKVPMLRRLTCWNSSSATSCTAFQVAPNLSTVLIHGKHGKRLQLPWAQLTRLRQQIPKIKNLSLLGSARNLVALSLTNNDTRLPFSVPPPELIVELPLLRSLYIEKGEFLNFLVLPALENIYIQKCTYPIISLIDRSRCRLRTISNTFDPTFEIVPVLIRSPTLREIRLRLAPEHLEPLMSYLTIRSTDSNNTGFRPPCPELDAITLCDGLNEHACSLLVQMVESRLHSTACSSLSICRVFDTHSSKLVRHASKTLEELRARGAAAEWLLENAAKQKVRQWVEEYPY
ncbi:hypothetical protein B0H14DRAFT_225257 [Mycena olivaceomarginata]|nr:hypothetical protein B0H14DRAFT_225257 [Mycena olivaceomarginata]